MKAAVLHGIDDIRYEDVPIPGLDTSEEYIDIAYSGICGSDTDRVYGKGAYHYPIILGHEFSGLRRQNGKKAVVFPLIPCKSCAMCQVGEFANCTNYDYYGSRRNGGFATQIAVKSWNIIEAPDNADLKCLAMAEPAAVALHAVTFLGLIPGQTVLITGAGPIGMLLAQWARISGAHKIYLTDIDKRKLALAEEFGFHEYRGETVDAAVEGTGVSAPLADCLEAVNPKGKVVLMGNPSGDIGLTQAAYWHILRKQLTLCGTWNSTYNKFRDEWRVTVDAIASNRLDVAPLISHLFPLAECKAAFDVIHKRKDFVNRVMFDTKGE